MKKIILFSLVTFLSASLMVSCGGNGSGSEDEKKDEKKEQKDKEECQDEATDEATDDEELSDETAGNEEKASCEEALEAYGQLLEEMAEVYKLAKEKGDAAAQMKLVEKTQKLQEMGQTITSMEEDMSPECKAKFVELSNEYQDKFN